jgi:tRNA threonylcarbamoyladenosine biosynthesis protein TsaB
VRVLALDTSTDRLSLALADGDARHARDQVVGHRHAETLFAELAALLDAAGLRVADLDAIAFGAGPGAFTGLRIASGVAQGLAAARGLPVIAVSCLEAIAHQAGAARAVVCIDARMGEVYHGAYARNADGTLALAAPPSVAAPERLPVPAGRGWTGLGSGFATHGAALRARFGAALAAVDAAALPTAAAMLELALPRLAAGEGSDAAQALPVYLRERVALTVAERAARTAAERTAASKVPE